VADVDGKGGTEHKTTKMKAINTLDGPIRFSAASFYGS
jgi:hypothetical protein